ncbi:hypothetical protein M231_03806 [Tremella mesenterica]|uniref:Uncharacterized protein n=1 Tax=Tremella mesenterica TaxID=5217 RepID=A0A4Q1BMA5_TREME|nr:hypothetical protein M231_03806 [Tremella mesenterica]
MTADSEQVSLALPGDKHPESGLDWVMAVNRGTGYPGKNVKLFVGADAQKWKADMVFDRQMKEQGLAYHPVIGVFSCTLCDQMLSFGTSEGKLESIVKFHLTKDPQRMGEAEAQALVDHAWDICRPPIHPMFPFPDQSGRRFLDPLPHLSVLKGALCLNLGCGYAAVAKAKGNPLPHECQKGRKDNCLRCAIQSLDGGNGIGSFSFPVIEPSAEEIPTDSPAHLLLLASSHSPSPTPTRGEVETRDLPPVVRHYGWDAKVQSLSEEQAKMAALAMDEEESKVFSGLQALVEGFFARVNGSLPGTDGIGEKLVSVSSLTDENRA